jgi:hypothetical protein
MVYKTKSQSPDTGEGFFKIKKDLHHVHGKGLANNVYPRCQ